MWCLSSPLTNLSRSRLHVYSIIHFPRPSTWTDWTLLPTCVSSLSAQSSRRPDGDPLPVRQMSGGGKTAARREIGQHRPGLRGAIRKYFGIILRCQAPGHQSNILYYLSLIDYQERDTCEVRIFSSLLPWRIMKNTSRECQAEDVNTKHIKQKLSFQVSISQNWMETLIRRRTAPTRSSCKPSGKLLRILEELHSAESWVKTNQNYLNLWHTPSVFGGSGSEMSILLFWECFLTTI